MTRAARLACAAALACAVGAVAPARAADDDLTYRRDKTRAYVALGAGLALTGASFVMAESADDAYATYLGGGDPVDIQDDYDRAVRLDRLASASLLVGQAAVVAGLYWLFVQRSEPPRRPTGGVQQGALPASDASWAVVAPPGRAGFALQVRFR